MASLVMVAHQVMMLHPTCSLFLLLAYAALLGIGWYRFFALAMVPAPVSILFQTNTGTALVKVRIHLLEVAWLR